MQCQLTLKHQMTLLCWKLLLCFLLTRYCRGGGGGGILLQVHCFSRWAGLIPVPTPHPLPSAGNQLFWGGGTTDLGTSHWQGLADYTPMNPLLISLPRLAFCTAMLQLRVSASPDCAVWVSNCVCWTRMPSWMASCSLRLVASRQTLTERDTISTPYVPALIAASSVSSESGG
jgi:hypothetical protein